MMAHSDHMRLSLKAHVNRGGGSKVSPINIAKCAYYRIYGLSLPLCLHNVICQIYIIFFFLFFGPGFC